ncbi:MAG TPA: hypothetical protein VHQ43_04820 [Solirubrobacterales bacterium]|jgi:hypothetical protein|nr:hypothetical protein [Solirubrobacterales bacterium]
MTQAEREELQAVVIRHIPREWRDDIRVDSVDCLTSDDSRPAGTPFARITARSKLGRAQAMLSIGPYVTNSPAEWSDGWQRAGDRWLFVAYEPSADPCQPTIIEVADQDTGSSRASSASDNS